jgi:hypothetical protein
MYRNLILFRSSIKTSPRVTGSQRPKISLDSSDAEW